MVQYRPFEPPGAFPAPMASRILGGTRSGWCHKGVDCGRADSHVFPKALPFSPTLLFLETLIHETDHFGPQTLVRLNLVYVLLANDSVGGEVLDEMQRYQCLSGEVGH